MRTVCAVVLTYNRREILDDCLRAISAQTHPCRRIVVIDNASTDGSFEMLSERWRDRVVAYRLPKNVGAAGGFNVGMRMGHQAGTDAIWVMDDDVIAEPDALERLVAANTLLEERSIDAPFVISTARLTSGELTNVPDVDTREKALAYSDWPMLLEHRMVPVRRATFVSILLQRKTLDEHGLPIADMFIWGEDTEFTLRVTEQRPGFIVGDSRAVHVRQVPGRLDLSTETSATRIGYHYFRLRNDYYMARLRTRPLRFALAVLRELWVALRYLGAKDYAKARILATGTLAGVRFKPVIERIETPFDMGAIRTIGSLHDRTQANEGAVRNDSSVTPQ